MASRNVGLAPATNAQEPGSPQSNDDYHVDNNEKSSDQERIADEAPPQPSRGQASSPETSDLGKWEGHEGLSELSKLQTFVVVLAICVGFQFSVDISLH